MLLWRISNHSTLEGQGGLMASARWHTQGRRIVYLAETPAGALLEALVHLELDLDNLPPSYQLLKAEAPDQMSMDRVEESKLAANWRADLVSTRTIGDQWLAGGSTALLRIPSAILPETWNVLLNPQHPEASSVSVKWRHAYPWDDRLLQ